MNTLSQIADKFEKLLERLPGAIRNPVEREWSPIRALFLNKRPARIAIVGGNPGAFLAWLVGSEEAPRALPAQETAGAKPEAVNAPFGWEQLRQRGVLQWISAGGGNDGLPTAKDAILSAAPDVFVLIASPGSSLDQELRILQELHEFDRQTWKVGAPIVALSEEPSATVERIKAAGKLAEASVSVLPPIPRESVLTALAQALPEEAHLEFARLSGDKTVQREIAGKLSRSATAVCAAIGTQPIPLADFPILTTLQLGLVAGIMQVAGRDFNTRSATDFLAALGVNVGAGLVFREGARAAAKLLPGWGNALSGAIAGAGTYAIGQAAIAYFIDGLPMKKR